MFRTHSLRVIDQEQETIAASHWYAIYRAEAVRKKPVRVRRLGRELVLWRDAEGKICVAEARCPHRGADLGLGRVVSGELACPYHGFRFNSSGACTKMPCEGVDARAPSALRLSMCTAREESGFIWLWHGAKGDDAQKKELPWVPGAPVLRAGSAAGEMEWPVRFSRVMEGLLDLHHVPFAHPLVTPPGYVRLDPYEVHVEGLTVRTRGTLRKERAPQNSGFTIELSVAYPGMVQIKASERFQGIAVCTPIDAEHSWIALRYRQGYVPIPGIGKLISWLLIQGELRMVQPDDLRILRSSSPRTAGLRGSVLVRADRGIAEWHKLHARALAASATALDSMASGETHRFLE